MLSIAYVQIIVEDMLEAAVYPSEGIKILLRIQLLSYLLYDAIWQIEKHLPGWIVEV